jgi:hypothetical protein
VKPRVHLEELKGIAEHNVRDPEEQETSNEEASCGHQYL